MKRLFIILFLALMFVACDKVYINGDLDGMWQLQRVERGGAISLIVSPAFTIWIPSDSFDPNNIYLLKSVELV